MAIYISFFFVFALYSVYSACGKWFFYIYRLSLEVLRSIARAVALKARTVCRIVNMSKAVGSGAAGAAWAAPLF